MRFSRAQLIERRTFLGASEVPILAGVSHLATSPHDLWISKAGIGAEPENEEEADAVGSATDMGHELEPIAVRVLARHLGRPVVANTNTFRHRIFSFIAATPDGFILDERGARVACVEAKAPGLHFMRHWGESGDPDGIPDYVAVQCEIQCTILHVQRCNVVALLGNEPRFYVYEHNEPLAASLFSLAAEWWERHVVGGEPPELDGSTGAARTLKALYPASRKGVSIQADPSAEEHARAFFQASVEVKAAKARQELAKQQLQSVIGDGETLIGDGWRASWASNACGNPGWKAIATELGASPELIEKHRGKPARKFTCKALGGGNDDE